MDSNGKNNINHNESEDSNIPPMSLYTAALEH